MVRSPVLTEDEIERRLREAYDVLFAFADRRAAEKRDAPAAVVEAGAGASESGDVESAAIPSVLPEGDSVKDTLDALQVGATQAERGAEAECPRGER
jgi:hypothetical protein